VQGRLTEEQVREALSRAEELHLRTALAEGDDPAIESVLRAAEEMGIPRDAMRRALEEKLGKPMATPSVGALVFARSADDNYYAAEVLDAQPGNVRIRFLSGGEDTRSEDELRLCNFVPGMKLIVPWPMWGWYKGIVVSYDDKKKKVLVSDGWSEKKFSISQVRLEAAKSRKHGGRQRLYWILIGLGVGLGGPIGALITWLLMR
jgi:hypothetical protein